MGDIITLLDAILCLISLDIFIRHQSESEEYTKNITKSKKVKNKKYKHAWQAIKLYYYSLQETLQ